MSRPEFPEPDREPIEHPGLSPPEAGLALERFTPDQILTIGKALAHYTSVVDKHRFADLPDGDDGLERSRREHEALLLEATSERYRSALGGLLDRSPLDSVGWLIRIACSGDEAGANVLASSIGAIAEPLDEEGHPTPTMQSLYRVLYALDMQGGYWANRVLDKLNLAGYLSAEQYADYMKNESPRPPMPQS